MRKFRNNHLTNCSQICDSFHAVAKPTAEPENSNELHTANNSTPKACFFIRSTCTPKERRERHSMVACNGKGFALCCVPYVAVSQPVTRYRPKPENFQAVISINFHTETPPMIYLFLGIQRQHLSNTNLPLNRLPLARIAIDASDEQQARRQLAKHYLLCQMWAFQNLTELHRTFSTNAKKGVIYA